MQTCDIIFKTGLLSRKEIIHMGLHWSKTLTPNGM